MQASRANGQNTAPARPFKSVHVSKTLIMSDLKNKSEQKILAILLTDIAEKTNWGSPNGWNTSDFARLRELITDASGVQLSVTTLKRLYGKAEYSSVPNRSTLDALAIFAGAKNWRDYGINLQAKEAEKVPVIEERKTQNSGVARRKILPAAAAISTAILCIIFALSYTNSTDENKPVAYNSDDFAFSVKTVAEGLPNSVVFTYDASAAPPGAVVEIQQNWDAERRQIVSQSDSIVTSLYYTPGCFKAKLVVDNQVVREEDVWIKSEDWLAVIDTEPEPRYFSDEEIRHAEGIGVTPALLTQKGILQSEKSPPVSLFQVRDFGDTRVNNFTLETVLRNRADANIFPCQRAQIILYCAGEVVIVPLSAPGCIAENHLRVLDTNYSGSNTDLSAFGVDFSENVKLKCVGTEKNLTIYLNEKAVFSAPMHAENRLTGIRYNFEGAGIVADLRIENGEEAVYFVELLSRF